MALFSVGACAGSHSAGADSARAANPEEEVAVNEEGRRDALPESTLDNPQFEIKDHVIISKNLPVVVDFYADWCGPCKKYSPVFKSVAQKYEGKAIFVSINTDEYPELAAAYQVRAIPTTAFIYTGGATLGTLQGILSAEELEMYVNQLIATNEGASMEL